MPAQKLLYQICWWKNKTKTDFVLFVLLEINFTKLKWLTCKTCKFHWYVSLFCIVLQQTGLKWWSYFYITLYVCTITWLSFCKEPARQVISLFVICWSLLTSPVSKHFVFFLCMICNSCTNFQILKIFLVLVSAANSKMREIT